MFYEEWEPTYKKIVRDFNFNIENDKKTAQVLSKLLENKKNLCSVSKIESMINNKEVVIFGAGPSLKNSIHNYKKRLEDKVKISADGATTALLECNMHPNIIVTDLDGRVSDQIKANSKENITVIHAHGDNINEINKYTTKFEGAVLGTTQTNPNPYDNIHNFGGFTDGDRAAYLAVHFHARKIYLVGFDFNGKIGKYSFAENKDKKLKLKKLKWCKYLIGELSKQNNIQHLQGHS